MSADRSGCLRKKMRMPCFVMVLSSVLILLAGLLLFALSPRPVYGVVQDELDGRFVSDAIIVGDGRWTHSDLAGCYHFGWTYGSLKVTAYADGYVAVQESVPRARFPGKAVSLPISLSPNTMSGTVRDIKTGIPLPGSTLRVDGDLEATADENGDYTLYRVKSRAEVRASSPGYEPESVTFNGQAKRDWFLRRAEVTIAVVDLYTERPISNAWVFDGTSRLLTGAQGTVSTKGLVENSMLSVQSLGYAVAEVVYDGEESISVALRPNTLQVIVRDSISGSPVPGATVAAISHGAVITCGVTAQDGRHKLLDLPAPITLTVAAIGYDRFERSVGSVTEMEVELSPLQVKGIYVPFGLLTNEDRTNELIDLVNRTELNSIVVDVKSDFGRLAYRSDVVEAQKANAFWEKVMDIKSLLSLCKRNGIYTIARLVLFKDSTLASAYPEWAVHTADKELWRDSEGSAWGDPFRKEVQDYNIAIAEEVAALGFDELQFDYLRFPSDGAVEEIQYVQDSTLEARTLTIKEFCARLRSTLEPYAVLMSADLFGLTAWVSPEEDMGIGQRVVDIAPYMDYLSPMLYPATFASGNLGYEQPLLYPYEVVYRSCVKLAERTETPIRPWLQHYSANGVAYTTKQILLQKEAAADAQTFGWMFWHASGKYDGQSFEPSRVMTLCDMCLQ
jgi:hypothetical protein